MLYLMFALACCPITSFADPNGNDTLSVSVLHRAPAVDGRIATGEYGAPSLTIETAEGEVHVWLARHAGFLYVAAQLPDSSYYWGDDLVISLDADGGGGPSPGVGDMQWYLRRSLDSSVVNVVTTATGRWSPPAQTPSSLGSSRGTGDWHVASESSAQGWSVELRIRESTLTATSGLSRIALRTFNDNPRGWWSWPRAPDGVPSHRVESIPDLWVPLRLVERDPGTYMERSHEGSKLPRSPVAQT